MILRLDSGWTSGFYQWHLPSQSSSTNCRRLTRRVLWLSQLLPSLTRAVWELERRVEGCWCCLSCEDANAAATSHVKACPKEEEGS